MVEIKKEAEALEKMKIKGHQRKNSQTPPPRAQAIAAGIFFYNKILVKYKFDKILKTKHNMKYPIDKDFLLF